MKNPVSYAFSCIFVLIAHGAMLFNVFSNGNYTNPNDHFVLAFAVGLLDIAMPFFSQKIRYIYQQKKEIYCRLAENDVIILGRRKLVFRKRRIEN